MPLSAIEASFQVVGFHSDHRRHNRFHLDASPESQTFLL